MTGIAELVANDGILPQPASSKGAKTKRKQGLKQAAFIAIIGLVLVPIWIAFLVATNGPPELAVAAIFFFKAIVILRVAYALLFQSNDPLEMPAENNILSSYNEPAALPPRTSVPADVYAPPSVGMWKETNELAHRPSVTDTTTKLLEKNQIQKPAQ